MIVTRPRDQAGPLVARLEASGHDVVECPLIEIERTSDEPVDAAAYDWVVATSPTARTRSRGAGAICRARRGRPGTAETAARAWARAEFVPRVSSQNGLLAEFPGPRARAVRGGRRIAPRSDRRPSEPTSCRCTRRGCSRRTRPTATSSSSPPARRRARTRRSAARAPAVSIGPQTTRVAESVGLTVVARGGVARPRRARRGRRGGSVGAVKYRFISFLSDFGLTDDFVGDVPRRDKRLAPDVEIIDVTHGIDAAGRARRRARPAQHASRICRRASTSRSSIPESAERRRPVIVRDADGRLFVAPTTGCSSPRPTAQESRARTSSPIPPTRSSRCRARSTAAISSRPPPRTSRSGSSPRSSGRRSRRTRSCAWIFRGRSSRTASSTRACSTSTGSGTCS